jgi:hypothetical protein
MLDRYSINVSQASKLTQQQNAGSVTPPAGFSKYMGFTSSSAYSVLTGDYFAFFQSIEGFNFADMAWGTASAATVTLSFWVRSSLTGAFGGSLRNSAADRSYPFSYTISAANTWEQKTITIAGDTSGTWIGATNGTGVIVGFSLGCGSTFNGTVNAWSAGNYLQSSGATSVVGTSGATFYVTGVQLEKGSTATSFDYRPYGTELALCQRYYIRWTGSTNSGWPLTYGFAISTVNCRVAIPLNIPMRSTPTASFARLNWNDGAGGFTITLSANLSSSTVVSTQFATTGLTAYRSGALGSDGTSPAGYYDADSEL